MIFSGFLQHPDNISPPFIWCYHVSFFQYGFTSLVINEFRDSTFKECSAEGQSMDVVCAVYIVAVGLAEIQVDGSRTSREMTHKKRLREGERDAWIHAQRVVRCMVVAHFVVHVHARCVYPVCHVGQ